MAVDWGASGRRDTYRFYAVDPFSLDEVGELECIPDDCSVTYGYYTDNKAQARVKMLESSYNALGRSNLVRIKHCVEIPGGYSEEEVLGTFFIDTAEKEISTGFAVRNCNCYSTMWRFSQDELAADFVIQAGQTRYTRFKALVTAEGATLIPGAIDTTATHTTDALFPIGTNRLDAANEYAGWCGWQLGVDDYGRQTLEDYVAPAARAASYVFEDGVNCTYLPKIRETFTGDVCNRVVAVWSTEKADPVLGNSGRAVADLPSASPFSFERCGRRITRVLQLREPTDPTAVQKVADDYLAEHDAAIRYIEIEHVGIPHLRPGMTVYYTNERTGDVNLLCEITQMNVRALGALMLTTSKLKVVAG